MIKKENKWLKKSHHEKKILWFLDFLNEKFLSTDILPDVSNPLFNQGLKHYQSFLEEELRQLKKKSKISFLYSKTLDLIKELKDLTLSQEEPLNWQKLRLKWQRQVKEIQVNNQK